MTPRAYERQNNTLYANPRDYRINSIISDIPRLQRTILIGKITLCVASSALFIVSILAIPTLIRLVG